MRVPRRTFVALTGGALTTGCMQGGSSTNTRAVTNVELLLNWKPSGLHVPYYVAKERGFYEAEGVRVENIKSGQGSGFSAEQAALGNTEFAITSSDQVLNVASRGLSPLSVGVVMQQSPVVVFTTREAFGEEFTSVEQLAGKTVGTGPGMVQILTKLLLERRGVLSDVELVDTGFNTVQRLLAGRIDAAGGVFGDVISAQHQGATTYSIPVAEAVPSYGHVIAVNDAYATDNSETVRAFNRATAHGAAWAQQNVEAAIDILVNANESLVESRAQQRQKWEVMATEYMVTQAVEEHGWGWSRQEPWRVTATALRDADVLGGSVDPSAVWTNDYLDMDSRYIGSYTNVVSG